MSLITSLLRPHHTNLDLPNSLRTILRYLEDQRSSSDRGLQHDAFTPIFDVREGPNAYFLEGELPGIRDKSTISIEWAANGTLVIRGMIPHIDLEAEWGGEMVGYNEQAGAEVEQAAHHRHDHRGERPGKKTKNWIRERNLGDFERTFTFPTEIEPYGMRAKLGEGLLKVLVPKKKESAPVTGRVEIE